MLRRKILKKILKSVDGIFITCYNIIKQNIKNGGIYNVESKYIKFKGSKGKRDKLQ